MFDEKERDPSKCDVAERKLSDIKEEKNAAAAGWR